MARSNMTVKQEQRLRISLVRQAQRNDRLVKRLREIRDELTALITANKSDGPPLDQLGVDQ